MKSYHPIGTACAKVCKARGQRNPRPVAVITCSGNEKGLGLKGEIHRKARKAWFIVAFPGFWLASNREGFFFSQFPLKFNMVVCEVVVSFPLREGFIFSLKFILRVVLCSTWLQSVLPNETVPLTWHPLSDVPILVPWIPIVTELFLEPQDHFLFKHVYCNIFT